MAEFTFEPKPISRQNSFNHSTELGFSKVGIYVCGQGSRIEKEKLIRHISFILCPFSFTIMQRAENQINYELSSHIKIWQGRGFS